MKIPSIETERLLLRPFRQEDTAAYAAQCADEEVMRWLGGPLDPTAAWRQMATFTGSWELRGYGHWALEVRETGELAGRAGLWFPEGWPGVEVGWALARPAWGRGYATEAARAAVEWGWRELDTDRIVSLIAPGNERSAHVAERLGMARSGDWFEHGGRRGEVWELLRPE